jgi:hypothetical protein
MKTNHYVIIWVALFIAAALLVCAVPLAAHGQPSNTPPTQDAPAYSPHVVTPESVTQVFTSWNAVALLIGATLWHLVLKITPFGKAHGGVLRGVRDWFWDVGWKPAVALPSIPAIPAPTAAPAALETPRRTNTSGDAPSS